MKIHVDMEISPEEARTLLGLPDLKPMQEALLAEMRERMMAALKTYEPEAMFRAWMPLGAQGLEQFQRFLRDSAIAATGAKKPASKE